MDIKKEKVQELIRFIQYFVLAICLVIIIVTLISVYTGNSSWMGILNAIGKPLKKAFINALPFFLQLLSASLETIWISITIYLGVSIFTRNKIFRAIICISLLCTLYLFFGSFISQFLSLRRPIDSIVYLCDIYIFILWAVPRFLWGIPGSIATIVFGSIAALLPGPIGFGIVSAIITFVFAYLHGLAALVQVLDDNFVTPATTKFKDYLFG